MCRVITLAVGLLVFGMAPPAVAESALRLRIGLVLERPIKRARSPILVRVRITNVGGEVVQLPGAMSPRHHGFDIDVRDASGRDLQGHLVALRTRPNRILRPGESWEETFNVQYI